MRRTPRGEPDEPDNADLTEDDAENVDVEADEMLERGESGVGPTDAWEGLLASVRWRELSIRRGPDARREVGADEEEEEEGFIGARGE